MNAITKHLGQRKGPLLIFGGVYSNYQALTALKALAESRQIPLSNIICTGDVVAYCAAPEACVQLVKDWGIEVIAGNVERNLAEQAADCGCNFNEGSRCDVFSRQWYPYAQAQLSEGSIKWMRQLPDFIRFDYAGKKAVVLHGAYFNTSAFIFKSTPWAVKAANFEQSGAELILAGHCGLPFSDSQEGLYWINAGVIGMPANDGQASVWYLLLDDQEGFSFEHGQLSYDHQSAARDMLAQQLPKSYAQTLIDGIWDNCEILPAEETAQQGQPILL